MKSIFVLALLLSICSYSEAQEGSPTQTAPVPIITLQPIATEISDPLVEAQALVDQAQANQQATLNFVNVLLAAIQAASIVIGLLTSLVIFIGGYFGIRSIKQLRRQLEIARKKTEELNKVKEGLEAQQQKLAEQLAKIENLPQTIEAAQRAQQEAVSNQLKGLSFAQFALRQIDVGNREAALRTLEQALEADGDNPVLQFFLGEVLVRLDKIEAGIAYLERAKDNEDMPDAQATLAYAYRLLGDKNSQRREEHYSDALSIYNRLLNKQPRLLDISAESVYGALAGLYRRQGRIKEAIETYEMVAEVTPNSSYPINNLGLLHFEHDRETFADIEKGRTYFEKSRRKARYALQAESADYWRLFDLITAEIALEEKSWEEVKLLIDEALDYRPISPDLQKLYEGLGQLRNSSQPPQLVNQAMEYIAPRLDFVEE